MTKTREQAHSEWDELKSNIHECLGQIIKEHARPEEVWKVDVSRPFDIRLYYHYEQGGINLGIDIRNIEHIPDTMNRLREAAARNMLATPEQLSMLESAQNLCKN